VIDMLTANDKHDCGDKQNCHEQKLTFSVCF